jgi:hypothetical protein
MVEVDMAIESDGSLIFTARFVHHFVMACDNVTEARKSLPDLTPEQFAKIRDGRARLVGDTKIGLRIVEAVSE